MMAEHPAPAIKKCALLIILLWILSLHRAPLEGVSALERGETSALIDTAAALAGASDLSA